MSPIRSSCTGINGRLTLDRVPWLELVIRCEQFCCSYNTRRSFVELRIYWNKTFNAITLYLIFYSCPLEIHRSTSVTISGSLLYPIYYADYTPAEPEEEPPVPPGRGGGGSRMSGASCCVTYEFFSSFLMFSKHLWRYTCKMNSTSSVVTYLIFEFLIPACYTYT